METKHVEAISKELSANDTGETGGHQAGICVPKNSDILKFFPDLGNSILNPRASMVFYDDWGQPWRFNFIYYNNKFHTPKGTRNEYRLTGLTRFFRENGLRSGDEIILIHGEDGEDHIRFKKDGLSSSTSVVNENGIVKTKMMLNENWRVIAVKLESNN
jgi:hypothetical protein